MLALALATQTSLYPVILLLPLLLVLRSLPGGNAQKTVLNAAVFAAATASLTCLVLWACGDSSLKRTWGVM